MAERFDACGNGLKRLGDVPASEMLMMAPGAVAGALQSAPFTLYLYRGPCC